jgi:hypothetical protein
MSYKRMQGAELEPHVKTEPNMAASAIVRNLGFLETDPRYFVRNMAERVTATVPGANAAPAAPKLPLAVA